MALDEVAGLREDKPYYALREALQAYFGISDQALPAFGTIDGLEATTTQQAWQVWQDSVAHDRIDIVVVGDADFNKVIAATNQFNFAPRRQLLQATYHQNLLPQVKQVKSQDEVTQARLVLGYTLMSNSDERFIANVFNGLFGGLAISRLFLNIREAAGLVYGISSDYNPYTGLLLVEAGVDQINLAITTTKINEQLQRLQQTLVSEEELAIVKQLLKTSYTMTLDQPLYLADRLYNQQVLHQKLTDEAWLAKIDAVTAEQVQAFAQRAVLQLQYEMVGGNANGD
nr:insulinase family protein [Weissella paramesenteroides]